MKTPGKAQHCARARRRDASGRSLLLRLQPLQHLPGVGLIQAPELLDGHFDSTHGDNHNVASPADATTGSGGCRWPVHTVVGGAAGGRHSQPPTTWVGTGRWPQPRHPSYLNPVAFPTTQQARSPKSHLPDPPAWEKTSKNLSQPPARPVEGGERQSLFQPKTKIQKHMKTDTMNIRRHAAARVGAKRLGLRQTSGAFGSGDQNDSEGPAPAPILREASGVRPACRRFPIRHAARKREQAPRTPNAGALLLTLCFCCCFLLPAAILAQASATSIGFQGALNGTNGLPLPNGSYTLSFRFYTNAAGGSPMGSTNVTGVMVAEAIASTAIPVQAALWSRPCPNLRLRPKLSVN